MKKFVCFLILAALMASSNLATGAERKYRNTIDWGTGVSMGNLGMYEYDGESVFARGIDVSLRYTRFIDDHWGIFLQGDISYNSASRNAYFGKLDRLDGSIYDYHWFKLCPSTQGRFISGAYIGGVYRLDINRFSFRPRVGFGVPGYQYQRNKYYRTTGTAEEARTQAVMILPSSDETNGIRYDIPAVKLGLQSNIFATRHFFVALDLDLTVFLSHHVYREKIYNVVKKEPNFVETLLTLGLSEDYRRTELVSSRRINTYTPPMGAVRFTIGWDF